MQLKPSGVYLAFTETASALSLRTIMQCLTDKVMDHKSLMRQFEYLNHKNPHTFEVEDLDRLIKSVWTVAVIH